MVWKSEGGLGARAVRAKAVAHKHAPYNATGSGQGRL